MSFDGLAGRVREVVGRIDEAVQRGGHGQRVRLVAVTKTHGPEAVEAVYRAGVEDVGENRVQEALEKMARVQVPVRWHLIGHLQRNKVRSLEHFTLLHSLDSSRLADAVAHTAAAQGRRVDVLLQANVSGERSKGGFAPDALLREGERLLAEPAVRVVGVMTMAPFEAAEGELRAIFSAARALRGGLAAQGHPATELSMGMSGDFEVAVEEGATLVRLGSILFGARQT